MKYLKNISESKIEVEGNNKLKGKMPSYLFHFSYKLYNPKEKWQTISCLALKQTFPFEGQRLKADGKKVHFLLHSANIILDLSYI